MGLLLGVSGYLADWSQVKGYLTTTQVRRYFNCGAFMFQTIFMMLAAFLLHPVTSMVCITIAVGLVKFVSFLSFTFDVFRYYRFGAFAWSGFAVNHLDVAPQYASILMGSVVNNSLWNHNYISNFIFYSKNFVTAFQIHSQPFLE